MENKDVLTLYHGSKSGIDGTIAPMSRDRCDFGKGFYMGDEKSQPLTLICNYSNAKLYTLNLDLSDLKVFEVEIGLEWALLIAYNRGKMETIKHSALYNHFADLCNGFDLIVGHIANDRMFVVLDRFFNGDITDTALINSLSAIKLGKQYVAITQKACDRITIIDKQTITENERSLLKQESEANRSSGIKMADEICRKYRRDGRFFDEILNKGE